MKDIVKCPHCLLQFYFYSALNNHSQAKIKVYTFRKRKKYDVYYIYIILIILYYYYHNIIIYINITYSKKSSIKFF